MPPFGDPALRDRRYSIKLTHNQMNRLLQARGARFTAALVSGVLFYFTLELTPSWLAAWLAPIPLLLAAFHASRGEARLLAWLAAAIGLSSDFTYYLKVTGTVATVVLLLRIPGQGGHDSEMIPVSVPKLSRSRFRDEVGQ
jgi:hypothetical protein